MVKGITGKILRIDLTKKKYTVEKPDMKIYRRYYGGEGFVAYFLLKELPKGIDPLKPENMLIFAAGPLTGVSLSGVSRSSVGAKSPLTEAFGESDVGGFWGNELKRAGYDAIIITGKAKQPTYLSIKDDLIEFCDANHLWGKDTGDAHEIILAELKDKKTRVATIGKGGENLVRYACIMHDLRNAAGRTGLGAVMGSKNLKAVAVRGTGKIAVADMEKIKLHRKKMNEVYLKDVEHFSELGTGGDRMESFVWTGNLSINNFRDGELPKVTEIDPRTIKEKLGLEMEGCYACPMRCKKVVQFTDPYEVLAKYGGPEYESLGALGSNCGITDTKAVCKANELCNRYSLDVISAGISIGFAMECFEKGILTKDETNGLELTFGNAEALLAAIELIAKREGIGKLLAEGVKRMAEKLGEETKEFAMHVKGLEIPMHEPRLKQGLGLGYMVSPTGADHMHNLNDNFLTNENALEKFKTLGIIEPLPLNDLSPAKVRAVIYQTNWRVAYNCLVMCMFQQWNHEEIIDITRAITGWNVSLWELMKLGERVTTLARVFNLREGFSKNDDWLPGRCFQPKTSGALVDTAINPKEMENALRNYYQMMGWTTEGIPTKAKLAELDILWASAYLPKDSQD
ncbi:MAG: aldehyde ferredoxin oxidoreductase family protein [Asgard group archaeon]|nr:aldehyde ferredoxin oxidoreductase family protein [Asgard group archaeon]